MNTENGITESIPVLNAVNIHGKKKNKMEYLIIILIAAAVIIAAVITASVIRSRKSKPEAEEVITESAGDLIIPSDSNGNNTFEPVTFTEDIEITFGDGNTELEDAVTEHSLFFSTQAAVKPEAVPVFTTEAKTEKPSAPKVTTTEYLEKTTSVSEDATEAKSSIISTISAFFSGRYYLDGTMISRGEKTPVEIAMNGSDFQVFSELDGKDIAIMQLEGKTYMLNPDTKRYAELTPSFQKMTGINTDDLKFDFNTTGFDAQKPSAVKKAAFNGKEADCYIYTTERSHIEFIADENEILQMAVFNSDGSASTVIAADEFSAEIPEEMLNFKGYSKTNMISFITSLM